MMAHTLGKIIGAAIVGIVCVCLLPVILPLIIIYTIFAVVVAIAKAIVVTTKKRE